MTGNGGDDIVAGGNGTDVLDGGLGYDELDGGAGNDTLFGGGGDYDSLVGGDGADTLDGGLGEDEMAGNAGNDIYVVDALGDSITELLNQGYDTVNTTLANFTLGDNVERVNYTGSGNFVGIGNALNNRFQSGEGDDRFVDVTGVDIFSGGLGSADVVDYRTSTVGISINLTTGAHGGDAAGDTFSSIERFWGSNTAGDTLIGDGHKNWLYGFGGNDTLNGNGHVDRLEGGAGNDVIYGNFESDIMNGGTGNDTLTGGTDADSFEYSALGFGQDTVRDFEDGSDKLKVYATGVADDVSDFIITGNGTTSVVLTLAAQTSSTITLNSASAITITNADFTFY